MFASPQLVERDLVKRAGASSARADGIPARQADGSLEAAFLSSGGVATAEEIALLLRRRCDQPLSLLARWIVGHHVIHFDRSGQTYMPLFQFDLDEMSIRHEVAAVLDELSPAVESGDVARWFVTPNAWLNGESPLKRISRDPALVADAARADRFVTKSWV